MLKSALLGVAVLSAGIYGYQTVIKPQLQDTVDSVAPAVSAVTDAARTMKDTGTEAFEAVKATPVGTKISEYLENRHSFFDPMPAAPPQP
jgi:hypothetical protein